MPARDGHHQPRALSANAVLMGRNTLYGAAAAGGPGIAHVISILGTELERAMTLLGTARLSDISAEHVRYLGTTPSATDRCHAWTVTRRRQTGRKIAKSATGRYSPIVRTIISGHL
ncbi:MULTISPECIES: alpha-hydroxy-acid oxidizing protein [unclassified Bradyrhizobium]